MDQKISSEIRTILNEFDTIKNSLAPIISEVKRMHEMHIELRRLKEETDSRLKKLDFEMRHIAHKEPPLKDVVVTKNRIDELSNQIESLRRQYAGIQKPGFGSKDVERQVKEALSKIPSSKTVTGERFVHEELDKVRAENKRNTSMLKNELDEVDQKHTKLMSATREKTAALITEAHQLSKQVQDSLAKHDSALKNIAEFENWFRHSEKTLLSNDEAAKKHMNQLVNEINNNRKDIYNSKKELERNIKRVEDFSVLTSKLEKKQTSELSEIKGRMRDIERKMVFRPELDKIQNTMSAQQKEELSKMNAELNKSKVSMAQDLKNMQNASESKFRTDIDATKKNVDTLNTSMKNLRSYLTEIDTIKKTVDSLSIKVANTSKIIEELEKVL